MKYLLVLVIFLFAPRVSAQSDIFYFGAEREFTMGENESIFAYKWGSCESHYSSILVDVTFTVDMLDSRVDVAGRNYLTGEMTDWAIEPMSYIRGQIYSCQMHSFAKPTI